MTSDNSPESTQALSQSSVTTDVQLILDQIAVTASRIPTLDEPLLRPIRWLNANLAWFGGILFIVLVALKLTMVAHLDTTTMRSLAQVASLQAIAFQIIPLIVPVVLTWPITVTGIWASDSRSIWAVPCLVTVCVFSFAFAFALSPWYFIIPVAILTLFNLSMFAAISPERHRSWRIEATLDEIKKRAKSIRKRAKELTKFERSLAEASNDIETRLGEDGLSEADRQQLIDLQQTIGGHRARFERERAELEHDRELVRQLLDTAHTELDASKSSTRRRSQSFFNWDEQTRWQRHAVTITLSIGLIGLVSALALALLSSGPWLPAQEFVPKHGQPFSGYALSETPSSFTVMLRTTRQVVVVEASDLKTRWPCSEPESSASPSLLAILLPHNEKPAYRTCRP